MGMSQVILKEKRPQAGVFFFLICKIIENKEKI